MRVQKITVVVEARRFTEETKQDCWQFVTTHKEPSFDCYDDPTKDTPALIIYGPDGARRASVGDWIVNESAGVFAVYKPEEFESIYQPASEWEAKAQEK